MRIQPYQFNTLKIRSRGYLPHWEVDNAFYFVRDENDDRDTVEYVRQNPIKAGLIDWKWVEVKA